LNSPLEGRQLDTLDPVDIGKPAPSEHGQRHHRLWERLAAAMEQQRMRLNRGYKPLPPGSKYGRPPKDLNSMRILGLPTNPLVLRYRSTSGMPPPDYVILGGSRSPFYTSGRTVSRHH
jgi:hypothetical protein